MMPPGRIAMFNLVRPETVLARILLSERHNYFDSR